MKPTAHRNKIEEPATLFISTFTRKKSMINVEYLREISGGNAAFINAMLHAFKDESGIFLRNMENGLTKGDFKSIKRTAHSMKPSGAYIGVDNLTLMIRSLEGAAERANFAETQSLFKNIKVLIKVILQEIDSFISNQPSLA
jgi:HPt (histidine-containing phosphotransfer) domain-containing protein